jgi:ribosomal protein S21
MSGISSHRPLRAVPPKGVSRIAQGGSPGTRGPVIRSSAPTGRRWPAKSAAPLGRKDMRFHGFPRASALGYSRNPLRGKQPSATGPFSLRGKSFAALPVGAEDWLTGHTSRGGSPGLFSTAPKGRRHVKRCTSSSDAGEAFVGVLKLMPVRGAVILWQGPRSDQTIAPFPRHRVSREDAPCMGLKVIVQEGETIQAAIRRLKRVMQQHRIYPRPVRNKGPFHWMVRTKEHHQKPGLLKRIRGERRKVRERQAHPSSPRRGGRE